MTSSRNKKEHPERKEPFSQFIHKMDQLFSERPAKGVLQSLDSFFGAARERSFPITLHETHSEYTLTATLPGIPRKQISIDLLPQAVTISAIQKEKVEKHSRTQEVDHREQSAILTRTIPFPKPIDETKVKASHRDGILTLHLPKVRGNRIEIKD